MADQHHQVIQLAENAKKGDRNSTEQLVSVFHHDIFRLVYYRTRSKMDAEDLTQEIFARMFKNISQLKDGSCFKSWLFRIAVNMVRDFHRKKKFIMFFGSGSHMANVDNNMEDLNNPSDSLLRKEFHHKLFEFTQKLSKGEQEVFMLRFLDQLVIREIAQVLSKSESTVKTLLYRAIQKFKQAPEIRYFLNGEK